MPSPPAMAEVPLFPLKAVLFPGGFLPLRVFERRYLDMVRDCVKQETPFGICLRVGEGDEQLAALGTLAHIIDWHTLEDGLLGIHCRGGQRFHISTARQRDDGLCMGQIATLDEPDPMPMPPEFGVLVTVLDKLMEQVGDWYPDASGADLEDAVYVGYRLSELLPLPLETRQALLEMQDPGQRLAEILKLAATLQESPE